MWKFMLRKKYLLVNYVEFIILLMLVLAQPARFNFIGTCICMAGGTHGRGEKRVQGFDQKAQSKKTTWKTKA
jgi:hypothetical protein